MSETSGTGHDAPRSDVPTAVAVAITAYALCDLVHEVGGHAVATLMVPGVRAISLSTVALETTRVSRIVTAAGSIANVVAGAASLGVFHRRARFSAAGYFFWLFGSLNLLNGSGYCLYSAVLGFGDWEVVSRGGGGIRRRGDRVGRGTHTIRERAPGQSNRNHPSRISCVSRRRRIARRRRGVQPGWPEPHRHFRSEQRIRRDGRAHARAKPGRASNRRHRQQL